MALLREHYQRALTQKRLHHDEAQARIMEQLEPLYQALQRVPAAEPLATSRFKFWQKSAPRVRPLAGLYLWGGVGRGKTFLIDLFYHALPFAEKERLHFQRFMQQVHGLLKELPETPDPLPLIARRFAAKMRVLCLDEFHVDDVADAMLLAGLLQGLIDAGVTLLFTSNTAPDGLYLNGLQRQRFLPAIALIKAHTAVVELAGPRDYRVGLNSDQSSYYAPHDAATTQVLRTTFSEIAGSSALFGQALQLNGRVLPTLGYGRGAVWFDFAALCGSPTSYHDYLLLAERYPTFILSGIQRMGAGSDDLANRFIQLIDALYDHHVVLVASGAVEVFELYGGQRLAAPFQRTCSRLHEMFSLQYRQSRGKK